MPATTDENSSLTRFLPDPEGRRRLAGRLGGGVARTIVGGLSPGLGERLSDGLVD
jgi:hypothetical protein